MYYPRLIDKALLEWSNDPYHKPLLLRGARQVGKSTAVRHLGTKFQHYLEVNFEKNPEYGTLFDGNLDPARISSQLAAISKVPVIAGKTLLFLDEIQMCPKAIMSLRFFKEDMPGLHVIAAGSLLEFALADIPTFGVGRIHSMFMSPMTFDEFLQANGEQAIMDIRDTATPQSPLPVVIHNKLVDIFRSYILVGGMPEVVARWVETRDYIKCQELLDDLITSYEDDFPKYAQRANPVLLRQTLKSAALQITTKFVSAKVDGNYRAAEIKNAVNLLSMSGLIIPVYRTDANGLPLGGEADYSYRKLLLLDSGITLRLLNMSLNNDSSVSFDILTSSATDLVNKGAITEMIAGLELLRYKSPNIKHELFYWTRTAKNSVAEIDYVTAIDGSIVPIEVKAGTQGGMKSLWSFMSDKCISSAIRMSLENFGAFDNTDNTVTKHVTICPLYAVSIIDRLYICK